MNIESIQVALRERTPWQAIDLGFNMSRQYYGILYKSYCLSFLVISLPIIVALRNYPSWASFLIWYLKPLFEVGAQSLLSRRVFGETFSNRQIAHITFQAINQHWWAAITSLRFTIRRSFIMPVFLLEGLKVKQRRQRLRTLSLGQQQGPASLTVLLTHVEVLFYIVIFFIIYLMIPHYERFDPMVIFQAESENLGLQWLTIACWGLATILVAPFYICSGFSLYLNKRIELEGWDLELSFKKIKHRLKNLATVLACSLLFSFTLQSSDPVYAEALSTEQVPITTEIKTDALNKQIQQEIQQILNNDPLVYTPEKSKWHFKSKDYNADFSNFDGFLDFIPSLSFMLEALLWIAVTCIIIWLIFKIPQVKKLLTKEQGEKRKKIIRKADIFGMTLSAKDQRQDLHTAVTLALKNNDLRKALALLLSSALGEIASHSRQNIPRGATENDCLLIAQHVNMKKDWLRWFEQLLQHWSFLAWGHKNIEPQQIEQLLLNAPLEELSLALREPHG